MALYEDKFCKLSKSEVVLYTYYFPLGTNKTIKKDEIKRVYYDKQAFMKDFGKVKDWGMALAPIWWACDMGRWYSNENYNVVIDTGSFIKSGFSVEKIDEFLKQLKLIIPDIRIDNFIPFTFDNLTIHHDKNETSDSETDLNFEKIQKDDVLSSPNDVVTYPKLN